jgi:hypothetical protein
MNNFYPSHVISLPRPGLRCENPDSSEAIEFLCLAEGGEVTHYEVMSAMTKGIKDKKFATKVKSILAEEKRHLQLCTRLAKQTATA